MVRDPSRSIKAERDLIGYRAKCPGETDQARISRLEYPVKSESTANRKCSQAEAWITTKS